MGSRLSPTVGGASLAFGRQHGSCRGHSLLCPLSCALWSLLLPQAERRLPPLFAPPSIGRITAFLSLVLVVWISWLLGLGETMARVQAESARAQNAVPRKHAQHAMSRVVARVSAPSVRRCRPLSSPRGSEKGGRHFRAWPLGREFLLSLATGCRLRFCHCVTGRALQCMERAPGLRRSACAAGGELLRGLGPTEQCSGAGALQCGA